MDRALFVVALLIGSIAFAEETPPPAVRVINAPGEEFADSQRCWQGIPSIDRTAEGRLFVAWYSGGDKEGSTENYSLVARSDDEGQTWSAPLLVVQGEQGTRCGEPLPWVDPLGRLWVMWNNVKTTPTKERATWAVRCDAPDANELHWTAPQYVGPGIVLGKPLVTSSGDWLVPLDVRGESEIAAQHGANLAGVLASADEGKTWTYRGGPTMPDDVADFEEHCLAQRRDGALWMIIRGKGGLYESTSTDEGRNWSRPQLHRAGPTTRAFLGSLPSGRLLLIYHAGPRKSSGAYNREHLTAFVSDEDGRAWKHSMLLDPRNRISYPDAAIASDGRIYLTYDYARYEAPAKEILFNAISEVEIINKRPAPTPVVVNRATGYGNHTETSGAKEEEMRREVNQKLLQE